MRCSELLRAFAWRLRASPAGVLAHSLSLRSSRWLLRTAAPPAPILPPATFARSQRAALRSR